MGRLWLAGALVLSIGLLVIQCAPSGSLSSPSPTPAGESKSTPAVKSVLTPAPASTAQEVLSDTVARLREAQSFEFTVSAVLRSNFEGRPREWSYKGSGAYASPDRMRWELEGQADIIMRVAASGGKVYCEDARGENTRDCSLAFGGPRPGSSPYTVMAYLKNAEQAGGLQEKSLGGQTYDYVTFTPQLPKVSALDAGHSRALVSVQSVSGEVWIDKRTKLPFRESVEVKASSPMGDESVTVTIAFSKFNEKVDIKP